MQLSRHSQKAKSNKTEQFDSKGFNNQYLSPEKQKLSEKQTKVRNRLQFERSEVDCSVEEKSAHHLTLPRTCHTVINRSITSFAHGSGLLIVLRWKKGHIPDSPNGRRPPPC